MNKKQFIKFLEIIKYIEDRSNELNSSLQKIFNDKDFTGACDSDLIYKLIYLLQDILNTDFIEYYIYELDWGKRGKNCIIYKENRYSLTNLEELYDFIIKFNQDDK